MTKSNLLTMAKAAEMVSLTRPTFYRKVKDLKISTTTDSTTGKKMVDVSELMRVFGGAFKLNNNEQSLVSKVPTKKRDAVHTDNGDQTTDIEVIKLKYELEKEKALRQASEDTVDYLKQQIEHEKEEKKKLSLLLTDQSNKTGQNDKWAETLKTLETRIANREKEAAHEKDALHKQNKELIVLIKKREEDQNKAEEAAKRLHKDEFAAAQTWVSKMFSKKNRA